MCFLNPEMGEYIDGRGGGGLRMSHIRDRQRTAVATSEPAEPALHSTTRIRAPTETIKRCCRVIQIFTFNNLSVNNRSLKVAILNTNKKRSFDESVHFKVDGGQHWKGP